MSETRADKPLKELVIRLNDSPTSKKSNAGMTILTMKGIEEGGKTEREQTVVMFAETAEAFLEAFSEQAGIIGEDEASFRPRVSFQGYWKKSEWTGRDGKVRENWEFRPKSYTFG